MPKQSKRCQACEYGRNCRWILFQNSICKLTASLKRWEIFLTERLFVVIWHDSDFTRALFVSLEKQDVALPAYLKKNEDRIPCAALLHMRSIVACECPSKMFRPTPPNRIQNIHWWEKILKFELWRSKMHLFYFHLKRSADSPRQWNTHSKKHRKAQEDLHTVVNSLCKYGKEVEKCSISIQEQILQVKRSILHESEQWRKSSLDISDGDALSGHWRFAPQSWCQKKTSRLF